MLFPVVVIVLLPEWIRRGEPFGPRARAAAMVVVGAFALLHPRRNTSSCG